MIESILIPPVAFVLYIGLSTLLSYLGRALAGKPSPSSALKTSAYASGEAADPGKGAPGYRPFFVVALFFAMLHLGILTLGSSGLSPLAGVYLVGLMLALIAMILG